MAETLRSLLTAAIEAYKHGDWVEAARVCEEGIRAAESTGDELQVCRFRLILSQCNWAQGRIKEAFVLPTPPEAHSLTGLEIAAKLRNQKGFLLAQTGKFLEAKTELEEALSVAGEAGSDVVCAEIQINRGTLFFYLADYDAMLPCGQAVLDIAERNNLRGYEGSACAVIGKSLMYRQAWNEAIAWYERALAAFDADGSPFYANRMRGELGCCYFGLGELDKAMELFSEALRSSEEAGALASVHTDHANIGAVHLRRGRYEIALSHCQKALEIASGLGDQISTGKWLHNLSLTHKCMGDTMQAMTCALEAERVNQEVAHARAAAK